MPNPFMQAMGGSQGSQGGQRQRNLAPNLIQYMQGFRGNPMEQLQEKLNSGEMTQQQYNQLRSAAEGIAQKMMGVLSHK